jgi:hypothetical protein
MDLTNIIIDDEFKEVVYKDMILAQDINSNLYLNRITTYEIYHESLKKYLKKIGKKPTQTDNLAYILCLTYPKEKFETFRDFGDLKLVFNNNKESDFESRGFNINDENSTTCICNEQIWNIHIFRNKYSGITIQVGSVCIGRYGLISKDDPTYKSTCKQIKEYKENKKEKEEGKPEGFYENERKRIKEEKIQKKIELGLEKELKKLNKKNPGEFKTNNCLYCEKICIYKSNYKLCICSTCFSEENKKIKSNINLQINQLTKKKSNVYCIEDCVSCTEKFISNNNIELCIICDNKWRLVNCKMCPDKFLKQQNVNDLYCLDCDEKIVKCIDCNIDILKPNQRCCKCKYKFTNNLHTIICKYCDEEEYVKEDEKWKKNCKDCYKKLVITKNCIICDDIFKIMPDEKWKTKCRDCGRNYKSK